MTMPLGYRSYAKLNLFLEVLNLRDDGYHNIETIFQSVDLGDDLTFSERETRISLASTSTEIGTGEDNLAHRAAALLKRECRCTQGVQIEIEKRIPVAAGLAGGSGNAAATLVALNLMWDLKLSQSRLLELALELGSDVPFCTVGGTIAATGRGEILRPITPSRAMWFVLVHPPITVSTSRVYNHLDLPRAPKPPRNGRTAALERAIAALEAGDVVSAVFNRMEEVVFADQPRLAELKRRLLGEGCIAAAMSGSGPTLFGICRTKEEAQRVAEGFPDIDTSVVRMVAAGVERIR